MPDRNRAWLYSRLSRDEDKDLNSLTNQKQILIDYANSHNLIIVGESSDDNVSGMHFERKGIEELQEAVDNHLVDSVLVKDLSRLGRHKTQTAIFIDYLKRSNVNVYSVTENINTLDENDDLIIGFKGLINDSYAKDISKKIRNGYKQKQKQGIVIIPPFGYIKNKNTKEIMINEDCANIVRLIYNLYLDGMGCKKIANYLNEHDYKSPSYYQKLFYNKNNPNSKTKLADKYLWQDRTISEIIHNEAYVGTLICRKNLKSTINHTRKRTSIEDQFRHENYYKPIILKDVWDTAQIILKNRLSNNVHASHNSKIHKYAGLLQCKDCNATFIAKWVNGEVVYVCNTYHRRGVKYCTSHRIKESELNALLKSYLAKLKANYSQFILDIKNQILKLYLARKDQAVTLSKYRNDILELRNENKSAMRQLIKYPDRANIINEIIEDNKKAEKELIDKIREIEDSNIIVNNEKLELENIDIFDKIINEGHFSNTSIQILVQKIIISEDSDSVLNVEFIINSPY